MNRKSTLLKVLCQSAQIAAFIATVSAPTVVRAEGQLPQEIHQKILDLARSAAWGEKPFLRSAQIVSVWAEIKLWAGSTLDLEIQSFSTAADRLMALEAPLAIKEVISSERQIWVAAFHKVKALVASDLTSWEASMTSTTDPCDPTECQALGTWLERRYRVERIPVWLYLSARAFEASQSHAWSARSRYEQYLELAGPSEPKNRLEQARNSLQVLNQI